MRDREESLFYAGAGPLAAVFLGFALTPLRGLTPASNLAFAFVALTIVVAELGGRPAALATAVASALSLDFFLTQPYGRLSMEDKHDVIAFVGLAVVGLIAAALGSQRSRRLAALAAVAKHRDLIHSLLREWDPAAPVEPQLTRMLEALAKAFPVAAAVVRDGGDHVLASRAADDALRAIPATLLETDSLMPVTVPAQRETVWDLTLPREGGRIALSIGGRKVGWLDLWGNGRPATAESRSAISDLARVVALLLAAERPAPA